MSRNAEMNSSSGCSDGQYISFPIFTVSRSRSPEGSTLRIGCFSAVPDNALTVVKELDPFRGKNPEVFDGSRPMLSLQAVSPETNDIRSVCAAALLLKRQ